MRLNSYSSKLRMGLVVMTLLLGGWFRPNLAHASTCAQTGVLVPQTITLNVVQNAHVDSNNPFAFYTGGQLIVGNGFTTLLDFDLKTHLATDTFVSSATLEMRKTMNRAAGGADPIGVKPAPLSLRFGQGAWQASTAQAINAPPINDQNEPTLIVPFFPSGFTESFFFEVTDSVQFALGNLIHDGFALTSPASTSTGFNAGDAKLHINVLAPAPACVQSFFATDGATTSQATPNTPNPAITAFNLADNDAGNADQNGWLKFDSLQTVPADATVHSAAINLSSIVNRSGGIPFTLHTYPLLQDWHSATLSWGNQPTQWTMLDPALDLTEETSFDTYSVPLTATVQSWVDGSHAYNGLVLFADAAEPFDKLFNYSESGPYPSLTVTYTLPTTQTVFPIQSKHDAGLDEGDPTANSNTAMTLTVGQAANGDESRMIVQFTLPELPVGMVVDSAEIQLNVDSLDVGGGPFTMLAKQVHGFGSESWSELNWASQTSFEDPAVFFEDPAVFFEDPAVFFEDPAVFLDVKEGIQVAYAAGLTEVGFNFQIDDNARRALGSAVSLQANGDPQLTVTLMPAPPTAVTLTGQPDARGASSLLVIGVMLCLLTVVGWRAGCPRHAWR